MDQVETVWAIALLVHLLRVAEVGSVGIVRHAIDLTKGSAWASDWRRVVIKVGVVLLSQEVRVRVVALMLMLAVRLGLSHAFRLLQVTSFRLFSLGLD